MNKENMSKETRSEKIIKCTDDPQSELFDSIVKKFMEIKEFYQGCCLNKDICLKHVYKVSSNDTNIINSYEFFLKNYGPIYGKGFDMYGPISSDHNSECQTNDLLSMQSDFKEYLLTTKKEAVKSNFLIASEDSGEQYYIDCSDIGKGNIYSIDNDDEIKFFSDSLLEFLNKIFAKYKEKEKEENVNYKIKKLLEEKKLRL
ncbi:SMI1/KNR4 family protein [Candidatus Cardinium hertigii]|uniref:SMI1/KNR4 family protein n=1 Tax=Candidatus Cardinium hertigii TaxID=247481 RepID=UPI003D7E90B2